MALLALIAAASAGVLPAGQLYHAAPVATYAAPAPAAVLKTVAQPVLAKADEEYDPHPQYKYAYDVQDAISGDSKSQVEERDGDVVRGEYSWSIPMASSARCSTLPIQSMDSMPWSIANRW